MQVNKGKEAALPTQQQGYDSSYSSDRQQYGSTSQQQGYDTMQQGYGTSQVHSAANYDQSFGYGASGYTTNNQAYSSGQGYGSAMQGFSAANYGQGYGSSYGNTTQGYETATQGYGSGSQVYGTTAQGYGTAMQNYTKQGASAQGYDQGYSTHGYDVSTQGYGVGNQAYNTQAQHNTTAAYGGYSHGQSITTSGATLTQAGTAYSAAATTITKNASGIRIMPLPTSSSGRLNATSPVGVGKPAVPLGAKASTDENALFATLGPKPPPKSPTTPTRAGMFGVSSDVPSGSKSPADIFSQPRSALQSQVPPEVGKIVEVGSGLLNKGLQSFKSFFWCQAVCRLST